MTFKMRPKLCRSQRGCTVKKSHHQTIIIRKAAVRNFFMAERYGKLVAPT